MDDLIWIGPALVFGFVATRVGLPPMVGYLIGGFILKAFHYEDPKHLQELGELGSRHGPFAIGILIMQDIFAVVFLALSTGKIPSIWALDLPLLFGKARWPGVGWSMQAESTNRTIG